MGNFNNLVFQLKEDVAFPTCHISVSPYSFLFPIRGWNDNQIVIIDLLNGFIPLKILRKLKGIIKQDYYILGRNFDDMTKDMTNYLLQISEKCHLSKLNVTYIQVISTVGKVVIFTIRIENE